MRVIEAYRTDRSIEICRVHYADTPEGYPPLGPVISSLDGGCDICDDIRQGVSGGGVSGGDDGETV